MPYTRIGDCEVVDMDRSLSQTRRLEIGVEVALDLAQSPEPADVVRRLVERATAAVAADRATVSRVQGNLVVNEGSHDVDGQAVVPGFELGLSGQPLFVEAVSTGRPVRGGHLQLAHLSPALRKAHSGVVHTAVLPLIFNTGVEGLLTVCRRRDQPFDDDDLKTLQVIGSVAVLALRNARLYAEALAAARSAAAFLDLVVHELRAPLTVIAGYVDMMAQPHAQGAAGRDGRALKTVAGKIREMQTLVDELVLSARLASGSVPASSVAVDLCEAVRGGLERAAPRAALVEAELLADLPDHPVLATCDLSNVAHILDNLLNNALSYGGLRPRICLRVEDGPRGPRVAVEDSGPGISPDLQERVFERFFRVNPLRDQPGSGMGLYISRQLAAQCAGTLSIERSDPERGTRFLLQLRAPGGGAESSAEPASR